MSAIGRWCFRHRFAVIAAWVLVLVGLGALSQAVKSDYNNSFALPGAGSTTAQQLLAKTIPAQAGDSDTIVWQVSRGTVRDATVTTRMSGVLKRIAAMPEVAAVVSPYGPHGAAQISRDGRTAYATVDFAEQAIDTSGRAVLFAGSTVCIALLGILVLGVSFLNGLAVASALTVVFTVLAAVSLLPALLGVFGMRVLSRRQRRRFSTQAHGPGPLGLWARWSGTVERRPAILAAAAAAVMLVLAIPVLGLRLGSSDQGNDRSSTTTRQAYDLLADGFGPGFNGPLLLVAQTSSPADAAALRTLEAGLPKVADVASVRQIAATPGTEVIQVTPGTSPEAKATSDLISALRNDTIPAAERGTTLRVYVGGVTATFTDFATVVDAKLPWFILTIVGLSFLLLVVAFRSLLIPATAAVMNLLAAATFGVLTAFFQWGWGTDTFGLGQARPSPVRP